MSYEKRAGRERPSIKPVIDMVMAILYIIVGMIAIIANKMGKMQIEPFVAYVLGGMIVVYGFIRFFRGYTAFMRRKNGIVEEFD